ncbi:hypothetical protein EHQ27_01320 [Leptospira wolffii]|uniref:hypothetical protein n=1 Tax=Leptospira wolffii TaxID=409998 RepID=UPI001082966C|nr:hypothetical protein [Leptospira wolffii]TGK59269.1 hypothetical protein EHQ32_10790 [Leptospira wolffii]TGK71349.1 hypothetical protein EHQ35_14555 [Leptospira wolffii]TGK77916.1 hypothetical protein EHQ27_01320 [Leptospira wolffii]TGL29374.1 hypothetical protein EHQ57_10600 [Leptospira wolffii]
MELDSLYEERKTPNGYLVKVRLAKMTYVVFTSKGPEVPKGARNQSIVVPVPRIVFLGEEFDLSHFRLGELSFVNVKQGKLVIPYQHSSSGNEVRTIFLNSGSECDILPVMIYHYSKVEDLLGAREEGVEMHHLVLDEEFPRQDLVALKIRFPSLNMLIIKRKVAQKIGGSATSPPKEELEKSLRADASIVDFNKVRATDLLEKGNLNMHSKNPVFLARVHLRKMELEKVKQLLLEFVLKAEEVSFIRTFLDVMIRNEDDKEELKSWTSKLKNLDEGFRLAGLILEHKEEEFEAELDKGFSKEIASMVYALLEKEQDRASSKEQEIVLWEWKLRAKRLLRKIA